jgi:hypothetical protein
MFKILIFALLSCLILPTFAIAETDGSINLNIFTFLDLQTTIDKALGILWIIAIPIALIMLLWAGIEFITSAGEPKKITTAKNRIKYTLIGIAVMILASSAVALVQNLLMTP